MYQPGLTGLLYKEFFDLPNLTQLVIQACPNLRLESLEGIQKLSNVDYLTINDNPFSGQTIPTEIGLLTKLTRLEFYSDELVGTFPSELFQLTQLTTLEVLNNFLTGTFPFEAADGAWGLRSLSNLESLWMNGNNFTGTIPSNIDMWMALSNLTEITLNDNLWSGTIPTGKICVSFVACCSHAGSCTLVPCSSNLQMFQTLSLSLQKWESLPIWRIFGSMAMKGLSAQFQATWHN